MVLVLLAAAVMVMELWVPLALRRMVRRGSIRTRRRMASTIRRWDS